MAHNKYQLPAWKQYLYQQADGQHHDAASKTNDEQLAQDTLFFKYMLDLIPPNFYFSQDVQRSKDHLKGKRQTTEPGEDVDSNDSSDEEVAPVKGSRQKRRKVTDPAKLSRRQKRGRREEGKTVTQIQEQLIAKAEKKSMRKQPKLPLAILPASSQSEADLRQKVTLKLQEMRTKRKATEYLERLERKKQKRRESKKQLRQKKQAEKHKHAKGEKVQPQPNGILTPRSKDGSPVKPIFNKEGKMVFSKFDFTDSGSTPKKTELSGSNYKQLLQKVEKRKQKMQELQASDKEKAQKAKEKATWSTALQKAEGVKVKDNPELLKKAIKKKEQKKEKRRKEWKDRTEKVEKQMQKQQEKRKKNIQKRKQLKVDKKIKKAKKKGRIIPGF